MKRFALIAVVALATLAGPTRRVHAQDDKPRAAENVAAESNEGHGDKPEGEGPEDRSQTFNFTNLDYKGKDALGGPMDDHKLGDRPLAPGEEEEPMPAPFLYLVGNFILLLIILAWKAGPAARKAAEKRSDDIKKALDEAALLRNQAKAKLDEYQSKLAAAEKEIAAMVEGMRADAEADKKRIIAAAEAQAIALKKDADERINAEILRARALLSREVAHAAAVAAEQLIRDKSNATDQARLVDTFISEVGKSQPLAKETV
jgi:F-type H+-transporting ATPase subunit b